MSEGSPKKTRTKVSESEGATSERAQGPSVAHRKEPVRYSPEIAERICEGLASGLSLRKVCEQDGMPVAHAVLAWARDNHQGFYEQYARAREIGYAVMAEETLHIAETALIAQKSVSKATGLEITEGDNVERSRLQVDTRKWLLSKMLPKVYGDKQHIEHSGAVDVAGILAAGRKRAGK
jgi:predicted secreted protein